MASRTDFPPIRLCIFDMDGLLINSEDLYTLVTNTILRENNRPDIPWPIKAQLQGRPGPAAGKIFMQWAQLPISQEAFMARQKELQADLFPQCQPLAGVETLLKKLGTKGGAHTTMASNGRSPMAGGGKPVRIALASSSHRRNYDIKTEHIRSMFSVFPPKHLILGDDERIPKGRGKPLPDIYLLALQCVNETIASEGNGERRIQPEECLVFEDSVPGIESGRRAGMRVVWVPHPGLLDVYKDRVPEVLAGRTGEVREDGLDASEDTPLKGSPGNIGELGDGWGETLSSLEQFDYIKYGIDVGNKKYRTESGQSAVDGITDAELEEMTARADGKVHAIEEGSPLGLDRKSTLSPIPGIIENKI